MQCKECKKNFSSMKSLQKHREISCFGNASKKTGMKKTQVDRLVLNDAEPEENSKCEPWKQTEISSYNEQMKQSYAYYQQLIQQRTDIQKRLADVMKELEFNNASGCSSPSSTRTADILRFSKDTDMNRIDFHSPRIKSCTDEYRIEPPNFKQIRKLREEYLKHGGQHPGVLKQMRNMEIDAKLKEKSPKSLMKNEKKKTQLQQSSHTLNSRSSKEPKEDQTQALEQQVLKLESENQHLQSQLDTLLPQVLQINDEKSLKDINRKHEEELLLLQQKIEIVKKQKELNKHEKELEEIIGKHGQKSVQQLMTTPKFTSNRYILPSSRNDMTNLFVYCDFISGLPPDITQCHMILYHFTESSMERMEGIPMSPVTCTLKNNPYEDIRKGSANSPYEGFAYIGKKQLIPSCLHFPNLYLVVELQVHRNANTTTQSSTEYFQTQAWTKIKITDTHLQPVIGRFFVPFKILPIIAKMSDTKFDAVPQFWKAEFYYQICNNHMISDPPEIINKHLYIPAKQTQSYYPKMRHRQVPPPPVETPPYFENEEYR